MVGCAETVPYERTFLKTILMSVFRFHILGHRLRCEALCFGLTVRDCMRRDMCFIGYWSEVDSGVCDWLQVSCVMIMVVWIVVCFY